MKRLTQFWTVLFLTCAAASLLFNSAYSVSANQTDNKPAAALDQPAAVEEKMHDLMENIFQTTYRRLKAALAEQPKDRNAWRAVKSDALILAEGTNLLFHHLPEKEAAAWKQFAVQSREAGKKAYLASKDSKYDETKQHFATMLTQCNKCHTQFADGKYQLTP